MLIEKPKVKRIIITARDQDSRHSKSVTVYDTTPEQVIDKIVSTATQVEKAGAKSAAR